MKQADQRRAGEGLGGGFPVQQHNVLGVSLPGVGQCHSVIPGHDICSGFDILQSVQGVPCIGGQSGLLIGIEKQSAVICGDLELALPLHCRFHLVVHGAAHILGNAAHNGKGGRLRRHGPGGDRAVEHIEPLSCGQIRGDAGRPFAAVNPDGLIGYLHHIFARLLRIHVQADDSSILSGEYPFQFSEI